MHAAVSTVTGYQQKLLTHVHTLELEIQHLYTLLFNIKH